jgi:hypothetical protein
MELETSDNKLQVRGTSKIGDGVKRFSAVEENPQAEAPEIVEAFEKLTDWQHELGRCLQSARSQRDLPAYTLPELLVRILDWTGPLFIVPEWGLRYCFSRAMSERKQGTFGFEASEISRVWREASGSTRDALFRSRSNTQRTIAGPPCDWCNATGFCYVSQSGERLKWDQREDGTAMKRCSHTNLGEQMDFSVSTGAADEMEKST